MRLGALDSLQRGFENLRANWQLILLVWIQTVLSVALGLAALLPFYFVLDLEMPRLGGTPAELNQWAVETVEHLAAQLSEPAFWLAVVSSSAVCVAFLVCYSFFQAGAYGVLVEGDRRVPRPGDTARVADFRAYSWGGFQAHGGRHLWSYFWLYNLVLLIWMLWVLLGAVVLVAMGLVGEQAGLAAGLAIGCAAVLPLGLLFVLSFSWMLMAQIEISSRDASAATALRRSLGVVVRRIPALALLFLLVGVVVVAVGAVFLLLSLPLNAGLTYFPGLRRALGLGLQAVQWLVSGGVGLALAATLVALYRSETSREAEA